MNETAVLPEGIIIAASTAYILLLFAIAYIADRRALRRGGAVANSFIFSLSIAVYCTAWTFYGSVGRAASTGLGFLPIYLGPTLMFALGWVVIRKIIRISKVHHVTSIADFISSRFGKSHMLGSLVTIIAVIGIMPYIALQLKAVAISFSVLAGYPPGDYGSLFVINDTALWVAILMAVFSILFGTRHIDATEHHHGLVVAIAFESVVKLAAFLAVGIFATFFLFDGFGSLFDAVAAVPKLTSLLTWNASAVGWESFIILAMLAVICLPRQFQVLVVENVSEKHLKRAIWLFPLYLFAINIFVLPIAFGGLLRLPEGVVDRDMLVLGLPLMEGYRLVALFAFIGGLSAATGMVIVETVALSTMICNDLVMPFLLRLNWLRLSERKDLSVLLLGIRRVSIAFILLIGYLYFRLIGESYALASIGMVSFAAAAQFAPAILGGIYWKRASRRGAIAGMSAGFALWAYMLLLPSFAQSGWFSDHFITYGPFGLALFKPYEFLTLSGLDPVSHAVFWSLTVNIGLFVAVSLVDRQSGIERNQATLFVEVFRQQAARGGGEFWPGRVLLADLKAMAERFLGPDRAREMFQDYGRRNDLDMRAVQYADSDLVQFVERRLSGAIGAASARVMVASTLQGEGVGPNEIMQILDETSHVLEYSRQLEQKSKELEHATAGLKAANERLQELDRLKDDFLSTVTHELRTPLTSIRSFSEILHDTPELDVAERQHFLSIIIRESERLTRLINQVLDLTKIETGRMRWQMTPVDLGEVIDQATTSMRQLFDEKGVELVVGLPDKVPTIRADRDQLIQVVINLLSNAEKFCPPGLGRVEVDLKVGSQGLTMSVADNGPGIPYAEQELIFEKFHQVRAGNTGNPLGSGLGLAICRGIIEHLGGRIWVQSTPGSGASFYVNIPFSRSWPEARPSGMPKSSARNEGAI